MSNENRNATTKIGQLLQLSQAERQLEHSRLMHCQAHAVSSELRVLQALTRRALAADQAGLISFRTLDAIHQDFMGHLSRPAPPGFEPPCIAAVMRTDQELWKFVSDEVGSKIQQDALGLKPLDAAFTRLSSAATVVLHLLPTYLQVALQTERSAASSTMLTRAPLTIGQGRPASEAESVRPHA